MYLNPRFTCQPLKMYNPPLMKRVSKLVAIVFLAFSTILLSGCSSLNIPAPRRNNFTATPRPKAIEGPAPTEVIPVTNPNGASGRLQTKGNTIYRYARDGKLLWSYTSDRTITSEPEIVGNRVVFSCGRKRYSLNASTGTTTRL